VWSAAARKKLGVVPQRDVQTQIESRIDACIVHIDGTSLCQGRLRSGPYQGDQAEADGIFDGLCLYVLPGLSRLWYRATITGQKSESLLGECRQDSVQTCFLVL